ncbi:MAG: TraY domain-containing protein [Epsilonproteobacteria bacterium]|nr:TraY domain-containing protein [Campylobacterota bacterium]
MKRKTIYIFITTILLLLSGCGSSGPSENSLQERGELNVEQTPIITYTNDGLYDLSEYILPSLSSKMFAISTYTEDTNLSDTEYGILQERNFFTQTTQVNSNQVTFYKDETFEELLTVLDDRLQLEDSNNSKMDIVRFADLQDNLLVREETFQLDSNRSQTFEVTCRLSDHLEHYNSFSDVLKVSCNTDTFNYSAQYYYAYGLGSIKEVNTLCEESETTNLVCTHIIKQYQIFN